MIRERAFDTGAVGINYAEGPESGPPLVLLHGLTGCWQAFAPMFAHFTTDWHVYACDLRGHGGSGRVAGSYRVPDYAADIAAFLQRCVGEPAILLGHSLGGLAAIGSAALLPEHVRALVLIDPALCACSLSVNDTPGFAQWFGWVYETVTSAKNRDDVITRCRTTMPDASDEEVTQMADQLARLDPDTLSVTLRDELCQGFDLPEALGKLKAPMLLMHGAWELGSTVRDEDAGLLKAIVPNARIAKVSNAGHMFFWEQMEASLEQVRLFLQR